MSKKLTVRVRTEELVIPTYLPQAPDKNPMFLEKRVYQGSSGSVYPLPFTDRISETKTDRRWKAVWLENKFLRVLVLPEIGGRIHAIQDLTNGVELIYRQHVIKPALVGLAGPWISGGIEFNWPQHHRPATFLPVDFQIDEHADGSKTVWCSDHDPMTRMKGMHGVCLHPGQAFVELKVRAYNRTPFVQTFLWWANVAARVHEGYQSFFPPDVYYVADHARRAVSEYPLANGIYYGINYRERGRTGIPNNDRPTQFIPPHSSRSAIRHPPSAIREYAPNDLSFYANIPTPCSYMCMGTAEDFFGGYDHVQQAGIIHVANHHISPGKKQWTWGNHGFGYAWDRNLTDADARGEYGPYIELMAGVYTDNQPDFSFLQPGETKTWNQFWYPIQKIGPAQIANLNAAIALGPAAAGKVRLGVVVTAPHPKARVIVSAKGKMIARFKRDLAPGAPLAKELKSSGTVRASDLAVRIEDRGGNEIISGQIKARGKAEVPPPATEPPAPADIPGADELFVTGLHLEQYRHATRCPTAYWREALRRDPFDSRCNNAMGRWHLRRGEFKTAEHHFRRAIGRLTRRNPNPYDGEPFYQLGVCLRYLDRDDEAYDALYKSTWNQAWAAAGYHALAEIDCCRMHWQTAFEHLNQSLRFDRDNLRARNLKAIVMRSLGRDREAAVWLQESLGLDPLDSWARLLRNKKGAADLQVNLDLAHDLARAGYYSDAIILLTRVTRQRAFHGSLTLRDGELPSQSTGAAPLIHYTLGWLWENSGRSKPALVHYRAAANLQPDYCFPSRLEEIGILEAAMRANPKDARAPYYLGNLLYDRRRHREAIQLWERSARLDPDFSIVWRNLGIGYFNMLRSPAKARAAYDKAFKAAPNDARLLFERDQLWKRLGESPSKRLRELEKHPELVARRDDLSVELCALYNQTSQPRKALKIISQRKFQPWEGGEGQALGQHVRTHLALGRLALAQGDHAWAQKHFQSALTSPENLSEAKHLLANQSDIHYWLGIALAVSGEWKAAREQWRAAATFKGDFQEMSVRAFSEMTYYSALSWARLGRASKARRLLNDLLAHARSLQRAKARVDYFATSLPAMLLFDDDLQFRQETTALFLQAQAQLGLAKTAKAKALLAHVLRRDPNHPLAADLMNEVSATVETALATQPKKAARAAAGRHATRPVTPSNRSAASASRGNGQLADKLI